MKKVRLAILAILLSSNMFTWAEDNNPEAETASISFTDDSMYCAYDDSTLITISSTIVAPAGLSWTSTPPGISGSSSSGTDDITFTPGFLDAEKHTVTATAKDRSDHTESAKIDVYIIKVDILEGDGMMCIHETSATLDLTTDSYSPSGYTWSSTPAGLSGSGTDTTFTYDPSSSTPNTYTVRCESDDLSSCSVEREVTIIGVDSIGVWDADNRHSVGRLLEVVTPQFGETITCKATMGPDVVPPAGCPEWTISGYWSSTLYGQQVDFTAQNYLSSAFWLLKVFPHTYEIKAGAETCTVKAFTNRKGEKSIKAPDFGALNDAIEKWEKIKDGIKNPFFDLVCSPPVGVFSFSNQWEEDPSSHLVNYVWEVSADSTTSIAAKAKLTTALLGIPPFLVQANAFVELGGALGVDGGISLNSAGKFKVDGGATGSLILGIGGEADVLAGIIAIGIKGATSITATGKLTGTAEPPTVTLPLKITAGDLVVSYEVSTFWGLWSNNDSWEVFKGWDLADITLPIIPGPF